MKRNLLKSVFISLILLVAVTNIWAVTFTGGKIYFRNDVTDWTTSNIQIFAHQSGYTWVSSPMNKVPDTKLYYINASCNWGGFNSYRICGNSSAWGSGGFTNQSSSTKYTGANSSYDLNSGSIYLITPANANNGCAITPQYYGSYNNFLKYKATSKIKTSTNGSSYTEVTSGNWPATVTIKGTYLSGDGATTRNDVSTSSGTSGSYDAVATGLITMTYSSLSDDYVFVGWGTGDTPSSTSESYEYYIDKATTVYAFFKKKHTITFDVNGHGTAPSSQTVVAGTKATEPTAPTAAGYTFEGWYKETTCTNAFDFNTTITESTILYAKWTEIPEEKFTITIATNGNGTVNLNSSELIGKSGKSITATPGTGYQFDGWEATGGAAVADENAATTIITATADGTVTANFSEIIRTINVATANANHGSVSPATVTAGIATASSNIIAEPKAGYKFVNWTATNGITIGNASNATTNITKATANGTVTANFQETKYTITIFADGTTSTTTQAGEINDVTINASAPQGYQFIGWIISNEQTPGCIRIADKENATTTITATGTGTITATFKPIGFIYFKNNPKWENVYVYFHTGSYWDESKGSGSWGMTIENKKMAKMERVGDTDIYRCHYGALGVTPSSVIAFTETLQENYGNFWNTKAAYRTDFNTQLELFIPQATSNETKNENTQYYSSGLWMKYNSTESGYSLAGTFNEWNTNSDKFIAKNAGGYHFEKELQLDANSTYYLKVPNIKGDWNGKQSTTITSTDNTNKILEPGSGDDYNVTLKTTAAGIHIFSIDLSEGKLNLSVEYPLMSGDYRMVYIESERRGTAPYTKFHPAQPIRYQEIGTKTDTISFYINKTTGKHPAILLQQCNISGATTTWKDVAIQYINGNQGNNPGGSLAPAKKSIYIGNGCPNVTENGVYNFVLEQNEGQASFLNEETHPYTGNYYIRTDCADGGWRKYNTNKDNIMTHSQIALTYGGYDYYFCKWVENDGTNIKYTVANDYNYCVSDTLDGDTIATNGTLPAKANVRFTWNSGKNTLERGYISGSSTASDRYLVLEGNEYLKDVAGNAFNISGLNSNEALFEDMGNWIYQLDVQANNKTAITLTAKYNDKVQTFFSSDAVADATGTEYYTVRFVYDFKTNNLVAAWLLEDENEVDGGKVLNSNMFIIRKHHEQAQQIKLNDDLAGVGTAYGVITFDKYFLNNRVSEGINEGSELPVNEQKSIYERALYWVSFPFDVRIKDVFGFGDYMDTWIMEYYDGEARAKNGAWVDSETYWTYITDLDYILRAGTGYVLCLDLDKMQYNSSIFENTDEVSLYFPSIEPIGTIEANQAVSIKVPEHICSIEREDRWIYDSNWNLIGVPRFINLDIDLEGVGSTQDDVAFYYEYQPASNSYEPHKSGSRTFQTMSAYMVQYAGTIDWWTEAVPSPLAARRSATAEPRNASFRLELTQDDTMADQTFVQLQEEGATAEFDMNKDLTKIINKGANIYSLIGNGRIRTAGNVLPFEEVIIPIGVQVSTAGTYTFAMPDGTEGMTVELIDYESNFRSNLMIYDYTTELPAGTTDNRFALHIQPSKVATNIEEIFGTNTHDYSVQKYIIDGHLYLYKNNTLYDAQGRKHKK